MTIRHWHRLGRKMLLGGGLLLGSAGTLFAQPIGGGPVTHEQAAPDHTPKRNYMNRTVIDLPITMEDARRAMIQEIHLYAKDTISGPWVLRDKGSAAVRTFRFQAPRDGE